MAITIELPSGERVSVSKDIAVVGSDERCDVRLAGLEPRHAQIRKVASRWLIESLGTWTFDVRDVDASRMAWLRPEDVISLTPAGLRIIFEPKMALETTKTPVVEPRRRKEPPPLPKANGYERAPSSEDRRDNGLASNDVRKQPRTAPPPLPSERAKSQTPSSSEPTSHMTHPARERPETTPPPLPSERIKGGTTGSSGPPPLPSNRTKLDDTYQTLSDLTDTTNAAGDLAVAEARDKPRRPISSAIWGVVGVILIVSGFARVIKMSRSNGRELPAPVAQGPRPPQPRPFPGVESASPDEIMDILRNPAQYRASLTQQLLQKTMEERKMTRAEAAKYLNDLRDYGIGMHNMERFGRVESLPGTETPMPEWDHID
jgi:hypothetical protein